MEEMQICMCSMGGGGVECKCAVGECVIGLAVARVTMPGIA